MAEIRARNRRNELAIDALSAEFDALFDRMQAPGAGAAMERTFAMPPAALGRAAKEAATQKRLPTAKRAHRARS